MNKNEVQIAKKLEDEGWKIVRGGWPDLLCVKVNDGKITDFQFVEVKSGSDRLSYSQEIVKKVLSQFGKYKVERIKTFHSTPDLSIPSRASPVRTSPCLSTPHHAKPFQTNPTQPEPNQATPDQAIPSQTKPDHPDPIQKEVTTDGIES